MAETKNEEFEKGIDALYKAIGEDYVQNNSFDYQQIWKIQQIAEKLKEVANE